MLEFANGTITEARLDSAMVPTVTAGLTNLSNTLDYGGYTSGYQNCYQPYIWQSYPVYVCSDKTAKAIDVLKCLEAQKLIQVPSVARFIELVETIRNLL